MTNQTLEKLLEAYRRLGGIAVLGLVGVVLIVALLAAWRRHILRQRQMEADRRARAQQPGAPTLDVWRTSAQRLPPPPPPQAPQAQNGDDDDDDDNDDQDDEDDDQEWWQKGG